MIIEGLNVLQPARVRDDGRTGLAVSDFFDFSVYVDAGTADIRDWYVSRFLRLRETAFRDPQSYFARYAVAVRTTRRPPRRIRIWDSINGPNLAQNVLPTRSRATLVLRKDADHSVRYVRLRKIAARFDLEAALAPGTPSRSLIAFMCALTSALPVTIQAAREALGRACWLADLDGQARVGP